MQRDFDKEIQEQETTLIAVKAELATIADRFVAETAGFLGGWYVSYTKQEIQGAAEITLQTAKNDLATLKRDVESLANKALDMARDAFNKPSVWWHINETAGERTDGSSGINPYASYNPRNLPDILERPLRYAMGQLAAVLEPRGFLKSRVGSRDPGWRNSQSYGVGTPYYPYSITNLPEEIVVSANSYAEIATKAKNIKSKIEKLKTEKSQTQAKDLWDSI